MTENHRCSSYSSDHQSQPILRWLRFRAFAVCLLAVVFTLDDRVCIADSLDCPRPMPARTSESVCDDVTINAQVKEALRLVCAQDRTKGSQSGGARAIVVGFLGGFVKHGDPKHPEVWFADYLRENYPSILYAEVYSNHEDGKALGDVLRLLDTNCDGVLSAAEKANARIIVYGHSWGASEVTRFAAELGKRGIPVLLTVQIDIVPKPHQSPVVVPANVERAVNFFQSGEGFLHGKPRIVAANDEQTTIEGNVRMTYRNNAVDCRNFSWFARTFNKAHHEIENDSRVWSRIDLLIGSDLRRSEQGDSASAAGH